MFRCERCGSSYNALRSVGIENCPRCQARDRKRVPLTFKAFEGPEKSTSTSSESRGDRSVA
jgi:predicted  nucleic acid-binding Zn-ribbon protein